TARRGEFAPLIDCWQLIARCHQDKQLAPGVEKWRCADEQCTDLLLHDCRERGLKIAFGVGANDEGLDTKSGRALLHVAYLRFCGGVIGVDQRRDGGGPGPSRFGSSPAEN